MRDALLLAVVFGCMLVALRYPFAGLLTWAWFSLMTPHQAAYGVYGIPLNTVIAGFTIVGIILSGALKDFRFDRLTGMLLLFAFWLTVSQIFSLKPDESFIYYDRYIKTIVFVLLCVQLTTTKLKFHALLWLFVVVLGYFGAKGGLFTIATLGQYRVQGLENTILEDNNHLGTALATSLPMMLYLRDVATRRIVKWALLGVFMLTIVAILGTHSRGAFVSLIVFSGFLWLRSRHKFALLAGLAVLLAPAIAFMPAKWMERMTTITEATSDSSFMGRVDAWKINIGLAEQNPLTGAGLRNSYYSDIAARVDPAMADRARAAHSIYFETLGGTGFVGLAIYILLLGSTFYAAMRLSGRRRDRSLEPWLPKFGFYAQISMAVFCVGGAAVSLEMWDGYFIVIAMTTAAARLATPATADGYAWLELEKKFWRMKARGRDPEGERPRIKRSGETTA